ncbi:MAG: IclR family transcriptional regulator [Verrucomicrobiales bacterium]|nr:IclR family transcriptional regulator [Verrucomicrobiales bacterium]
MKSLNTEPSPSPSLSPGTDRTLSILETLGESAQGLSVAELVRALGIPQNSVFRITTTLHDRGYLHRREDDKRFLLSNKFLDLVRPKANGKSLAVCAYEPMKSLSAGTGETVQLLVRSDRKGMVLEQVVGRHPVKVMGEIGLRVPLYSCAPGKALLASLPKDDRRDWLAGVKLKKFTPATISTKKGLEEEMQKIAEAGYAVDLAEGLEGIHCVAAPILNEYQYPIGAVTVMAPAFRLHPDQFHALGLQCIATAKTIRERLLS